MNQYHHYETFNNRIFLAGRMEDLSLGRPLAGFPKARRIMPQRDPVKDFFLSSWRVWHATESLNHNRKSTVHGEGHAGQKI
jgi:hypothetical protein